MPRGPALIWTNMKLCQSKEEIDTWLERNTEWRFDTAQDGDRFATDIHVCYYSNRNRQEKFNCKAKMRIRNMKDLTKNLRLETEMLALNILKQVMKEKLISSNVEIVVLSPAESDKSVFHRLTPSELEPLIAASAAKAALLPRTLLCHSYQSLPSAERCQIACCSISTSSVHQSDSSQQLSQAKVPPFSKSSSRNSSIIPKDYAFQINGLPKAITKDMLQYYFSSFGTVLDCKVVTTSNGCCAELVKVFGVNDFHLDNGHQIELNSMKPLRSFEVVVDDFPRSISSDELRDYFSSFGESPLCVRICNSSHSPCNRGYAAFASEDTLSKVLSACYHKIVGNYVDMRRHYRDELTLYVGGLKYNTTNETLHTFYSKFGSLSRAEICLSRRYGDPRGYGFVTFDFKEGIDAAFDSQPHVIDDEKVDLLKGVGGYTLTSKSLPYSATEKDVRNVFAPFGSIIDCELLSEVSICLTTFSSEEEMLKALKYAPTVLHGKKFTTKPLAALGSLQRKVVVGGLGFLKSKKILKMFFSIYGKVVDCGLRDDFGYVVFASAKDAQTVLRSGPYKIDTEGSRSVYVYPFV